MKKGQTLVEIVVAIGVFVLLVTGLLVGATVTLKAALYSRTKSLALSYAEEAMEKARAVRDTSWDGFLAYGSPGGVTWCLSKAGAWSQSSGTCPVNIDSVYTRSVVFTWQDPRMTVDASVTWSDASRTYRVDQTTYLTQWQ